MRMKQHVTTSKSMLLQEKEFLYNFWCIMNPLNKPEVENALLYDVLLLLIFNVQHPVHVTKGFLSEYLDSLYQELGVQAESDPLGEFLMHNNLWSVEKISAEFKKIHANKVSNVFSEVKPLLRN